MTEPHSGLAALVAAAMDRMGPFEPRPALAVAVSGGGDSMALAILARDWTSLLGGSVLALVVDHGLRAASADEARITGERLTKLGISARPLPISNLNHGPALAERARIMRYEILTRACREAGIVHLLLGHHAADQVETLAMRVLRGSRTPGLAGMPAVRETAGVRLLRPLLGIEPIQLRNFLTACDTDWVEDPSNRDVRALRVRLRARLGSSCSPETGLTRALSSVGRLRAREEARTAAELACRATIRPEGFAFLSAGRIGAAALACLVRTIGGAAYSSSPTQIANLAREPRAATIGGVRILPAGRFGNGVLIVREEAAIAEPAVASADTVWDNRFRTIYPGDFPPGAMIGKLGPDAARFRDRLGLPTSVLRTLPAIRFDKILAAVPHLGYASCDDAARMTLLFHPQGPVGGPCFVPAI